jgi:hypothetical protein
VKIEGLMTSSFPDPAAAPACDGREETNGGLCVRVTTGRGVAVTVLSAADEPVAGREARPRGSNGGSGGWGPGRDNLRPESCVSDS